MKKLSKIIACCVVLGGFTSMANAVENQNNPNSGTYNRNKSINPQNKEINQSQDSYYYKGNYQKNKNNSDANQRDIQNPTGKKNGYLSLADRFNTAATTSDQELVKKIHDKIGSGWFSKGYEQVTVNVNNGVVTLSGSVKTQADKEKVEKEVRNLDGVKKLDSQIVVRDISTINDAKKDFSQDTFATSADEQLNKKIRDDVSRGWLWNDYEDVYLNTANGVVTLNGEVDDRDDETTLLKEIQKVEGVKSVKSNLRIDNND